MLIVHFDFRDGPASLQQSYRVPESMTLGELVGRAMDQLAGMTDGAALVKIMVRPQFWSARDLQPHIDDAMTLGQGEGHCDDGDATP